MTHYLLAGAVRIQPWLTRTPELRLLRGASAGLKDVTSDRVIRLFLSNPIFAGAAAIVSEAGDVDGSVAIEVTDPARTADVRTALMTHLRTEIPGLEWVSWAGEASGFVEASEYAKAAVEAPEPPSLRSVPFGTACGCGEEPATSERFREGKRLGPDCAMRDVNAEADDPEAIREFRDLARADGLDAAASNTFGDKRNHLALICADGNGIGKLFHHLAELASRNADGGLYRQAVIGLDAATREAVDTAAKAIGGGQRVLPMITHYIGGDDVLVSVPARFGWTFATALGVAFESQMAHSFITDAQTVDPELASIVAGVGLGIGMVFHHHSYPIALARQEASDQLRNAKRHTSGGQSAVAWSDLTSGSTVAQAITVEHLEAFRRQRAIPGRPVVLQIANLLLTVPPAARAVLRELAYGVVAASRNAAPAPPVALPPEVRLAAHLDRIAREDLSKMIGTSVAGSEALIGATELLRWWPQAGADLLAPHVPEGVGA